MNYNYRAPRLVVAPSRAEERKVLPLGKTEHVQHRGAVTVGLGEPGVVHGQ